MYLVNVLNLFDKVATHAFHLKEANLDIIAFGGARRGGNSLNTYKCFCGNIFYCQANRINRKEQVSCGCSRRSRTGEMNHFFKHGRTASTEHTIWTNMIQRTCNPSNPAYASYGARGINVSPQWKNSFEQFYKDMGPRHEGLSLDRIDNDQGYYKENCRWATDKQKANNRRKAKCV